MTKTLTEQWRDGELELNSLWFVRLPCGLYDECFYTGSTIFMKSISGHDEKIWQVLAPVPSYDKVKEMSQKIERLEFDNEALEMAHNEGKEINAELVSKTEQLEKQLAIATKALKEYSVSDNWFMEDSEGKCWSFNKQYPWRIGFKALKEMEGVK